MTDVNGARPSVPDRRLTVWLLGSGGVLVGLAAVLLVVANGHQPSTALTLYVPATSATCAAFSVLGALILRRHRRQPVGLLLVALGFGTGLTGLSRA